MAKAPFSFPAKKVGSPIVAIDSPKVVLIVNFDAVFDDDFVIDFVIGLKVAPSLSMFLFVP